MPKGTTYMFHLTSCQLTISDKNRNRHGKSSQVLIQLAYRDVVAVGPVADISIRKRGIICDLGPGFDIFIGSVTHGPTSIVWRHITVGPECIWKASSIRVQLIHTISPRITSHLNVFAVFPRSLEREKNQEITHSRRNRYRNKCSTEQDIVGW